MVAWRRTHEGQGHSMARVERLDDGWLCSATEVLASVRETVACTFRVRLDADWLTREVEVRAIGEAGEGRLQLRADEHRRWRRDGRPAEDLDGCVDVDVAATPLTNTFPIRRLAGLAVGEEVTTPIAWVDVPALGVTRVEQTYRRLGPRRWQYRDPQHGAFTLTVDQDGLVVDYEGFATRVEVRG